ncbi:P-loop containing nucleoside triphosphate hydrolase protein [Rickenella mellea]|uniref:P-loop containing nucleoside triphosphate hydrolase protein n=1 Tax=Rickenella mellea TaxID=50990 RepID=A0A4Y7PX98_9AGAM|nr:P-loop containing nucleoside triphosphate hydrolase protein [Rickenella mellea]
MGFMNSVCTKIMEMTPKQKMVYCMDNHTRFVRTKNENEVKELKANNKQQEEIAHIKNTYANLVKKAKSKQKIIDKMEAAGLIGKVETQRPLCFNFENASKLPPPILAFNDVAFSYSDKKEDYLYQNLSFGVDMDSRIAILRANGTGKSTLLNLIMGLLQPCSGTISKQTSLKLAKYSEKYTDKDVMAWRAQLAPFGLKGEHQTSPIRRLSGGLRNRVVFAQLAMEHPHLLLLGEPTSHLGMTSIDALARISKSTKQASSSSRTTSVRTASLPYTTLNTY